jgi:hypothetical protein
MANMVVWGMPGVMLFLLMPALRAAPPIIWPPTRADTVYVAPPTGDRDNDRASIVEALEQVQPRGTVQFASGMYLIGGEIIRVTVPQVTLLGHSDGTTLRACNPDEYEFSSKCHGLELAGGQQSVRGLTFEYAFWALHIGCCWDEIGRGRGMRRGEGGHLIEGNTFRKSATAVRVYGDWSEPSLVRNNLFLNNWHAVHIYGNTVHLLENEIAAPEPQAMPLRRTVWDAVYVASPVRAQNEERTPVLACANNVVVGNRIEGYPYGIIIDVWRPGTSCRQNVIRDNTIAVRGVPTPSRASADSVLVGTPLALVNSAEAFRRAGFVFTPGEGWNRPGQPRGNEEAAKSVLEDNLIEANHIVGAEGLGIEMLHASHNRIVNNTFIGIQRRDPFPGHSFGQDLLPEWGRANGSAIWLSSGSDDNQIVGNTFVDVAAYAVYLEGDRNVVETPSAGDAVYDAGTGNQVRARDTTTRGRPR